MSTTTRPGDERGAVAVVFAISLSALLILTGLILDLGLARDTRRQSQNASDASALAAANKLYPSTNVCTLDVPATPPCYKDAVDAAKSYALTNFNISEADWAACTDGAAYYYPPLGSPCISFTDDTLTTALTTQPTKVRVVAPVRDVETGFGNLAGVRKIPINSVARATLKPGQARSCGLCILDTSTSGLGNGDVTVNGGSVHTNGSINTGPNGHLTATPSPNSITLSGTCSGNCDSSPPATSGVAPITDPYASVITFPFTGLGPMPSPTPNPCVHGPGRYGTYAVPNNTVCTLTAGLYTFTGTFSVPNTSKIMGTGVTLYFPCGTAASPANCSSSGAPGGSLDVSVGDIIITAPVTGPTAGWAVVYDRYNTSPLKIQGNGTSNITGLIYAPRARMEFPGTTCITVTNGPVIVGSLYGNGNTGCVTLQSVTGASIPSPPNGVSLDQ